MQDKNLDNEAQSVDENVDRPITADDLPKMKHTIFVPKADDYEEEPPYVSFIDSCKRQVSDFQTIGGMPAYETINEVSKNKPKYFERSNEKLLTSAKRFSIFGLVSGPVSLFIGGLFLAAIGLICNFVAHKLLGNVKTDDADEQYERKFYGRFVRVGLVLNLISVAINAYGLYLYYSYVM